MERLTYKRDMSIEQVQKMYEDLLDLILLVEHQNEIIMGKIKGNSSVFCSFLKPMLLSNNAALTAMVKAQNFLNDTLAKFLSESEDGESGHT